MRRLCGGGSEPTLSAQHPCMRSAISNRAQQPFSVRRDNRLMPPRPGDPCPGFVARAESADRMGSAKKASVANPDQTLSLPKLPECAAPEKEQNMGKRRACIVSLVILSVAYLSLSAFFTTHIRAWTGDDEIAHTDYVEYIVQHGAIPRISLANGDASHQPPLYYLVAAGWQEVLGIPSFHPKEAPAPKHLFSDIGSDTLPPPHYSPLEHRQAVDLHYLRLLSILLGLGTVFLAYSAAKIVRTSELLALSIALTVALLPKELEVSSVVTNDALVIPLCALALVLFLLAERARIQALPKLRRRHLLLMGLTLGAAAITKFDSLPICAVLFVVAVVPVFLPAFRTFQARRTSHRANPSLPKTGRRRSSPTWGDRLVDRRSLVDVAIAMAGFLVVSGWWFIRNKYLYGQFSATTVSQNYLKPIELDFHPFSVDGAYFHAAYNHLLTTAWFDLLFWRLPVWVNGALWAAALSTLLIGSWSVLTARRRKVASRLGLLSSWGFVGCTVGGIVAFLIILKSTGLAFGRNTYVGIAAFAFLINTGTTWIARQVRLRPTAVAIFLWPAALLALDLYVIARFLLPGGL